MKSLLIVALAVLAVCAEDKYTTENDNLDIDAVVADLETLQKFVNCFTDKGDCDPIPGDFKKDTPEAVKQACAKCTDAQKHIFRIFLEGLKKKLPAEYNAYKTKYDPEDKYFTALEAAVAKA